jgi:DNA-binding CsgD family transcriptional regulator
MGTEGSASGIVRTSLLGNRRFLVTVAAIQAFCGATFAVDILYESHIEFLNESRISAVEAFHLAIEALAVALLFLGYFLAQRQIARLVSQDAEMTFKLDCLRGQFDRILGASFDRWRLSMAERDIALLSLRGVSIAEIARMRDTREGTVKAQLSAVYHKAGFANRQELLAFFMDEFLDFAAGTAEIRRPDGGSARAAPSRLPFAPQPAQAA